MFQRNAPLSRVGFLFACSGRVETMPAQVVTLPRMGDVDSVGLIDGEFRRHRTMEPITATVVIVALIALGC